MKKYVFKSYSKTFPKLFKSEKARITTAIKDNLIIEHVGSTAVPGLGGKGIIDIVIAVEKRKINSVSKQLQKLGYEFKPTGGTKDRLFFQIVLPDKEEAIRTYHIHLIYCNSHELINLLAFRDYLRNNPNEARKYAASKKKAAKGANEDRDKYMSLKSPTIAEILESILKEQKLP